MEWKEIGCNKEEIISKEIEESAMDTIYIRGGLFFISDGMLFGDRIAEICSEHQGRDHDKCEAHHPCNRLTYAHGDVTVDRNQPQCKYDLADHLERAADQRCHRVAHALKSISHYYENCHRRDTERKRVIKCKN